MKSLKRRTAGMLSAVMLLTTALPGPVYAETVAQDDEMVTVTVKNVPGGALLVETAGNGKILPLDQPVELPKGTQLWLDTVTGEGYFDGSYFLADIKVNERSFGRSSEETELSVDEDMTIIPEFIRVKDEDDDEIIPSVRLSFQTEKGLRTSYKIETSEQTDPIQLYDRRAQKKAEGSFGIRSVRKYSADTKPHGEYVEPDLFEISEDGFLHFTGEVEDKTSYMIQCDQYQNAENHERRRNAGSLYLTVGTNRVQANYPIAVFEGMSDELGDSVYASGVSTFTENENDTIAALLDGKEADVYNLQVKGWTDSRGKNVSGQTLKALDTDRQFDIAGNGYYPVYAEYESYQPVTIKKLDEITELVLIDYGYSGDGTSGSYIYADTGKPVSDAFISDFMGDYEYRYVADGEVVTDQLIKADKQTKWYQDIDSWSGAYRDLKLDKNVNGSVYYYADENGKLVKNKWVTLSAEVDSGKGEWWYYFGEDGKAFTDGSYVINGKTYRFDKEGKCLLPGWFVKDGKWTFLDGSGEPVQKTFVKSEDKWFYVDADGFMATGSEQTVKMKRNAEWYEAHTDKDEWEVQSFQPNKDYKSTSVYYLIDETGEMQMNCWNADETMYFGADGRAYQSCSTVVDGVLYRFDRNGLAEKIEPIENAKPSEVASQIEKLKLEVSTGEANTRDEAESFVTEAITALLPMGFEIATMSDAKRADGNAFKASEDGQDGYWRYDVTVTNNEAEDVATESTAKRSARVATSSSANKFYATAEDCKLTIRADVIEPDISAEMEEVLNQAKEELDALQMTQETAKDQKAAEAAIEAAVKAVLPEGWRAQFSYADYIAPKAGTKTDKDGTDGAVTVTVTIIDPDDNEASFTKSLTIKATPYGDSETDPGDKPDGERPNYSGSSGGSNGYATKLHAAVLDTKGSWQQDANGWRFVIASTGAYAKDAWHRINGKWYYFGSNTYAVKGWNLINGKWYYMDEEQCSMLTGWHEDAKDGNWYLLNQDGSLALGWVELGGKSYFLNNVSETPTYTQDPATGSWQFNGSKNLPYGAMFRNARTPDGYWVGADGAWDGQNKA